MDAADFWKELDRIRDLPTLPSVAVEINRLMADEDSPVDAISALIEKDLVLSARILKLVNSSFFGLPSQVASIHRAMVLLGFNQVRNAVYAVTVLEAVGRSGSEAPRMWRHGAAVAATAQFIARDMMLAREIRENSFTAGLLHDIGKFVLWRHFPDLYGRLEEGAGGEDSATERPEMKESAVTHAEVGAHLLRRWQLPKALLDATRFHHRPSKAEIDPLLAALVQLADQVVHRIEGTRSTVQSDLLDPPQSDALAEWRETPQERLAEVAAHIAAATEFFSEE